MHCYISDRPQILRLLMNCKKQSIDQNQSKFIPKKSTRTNELTRHKCADIPTIRKEPSTETWQDWKALLSFHSQSPKGEFVG